MKLKKLLSAGLASVMLFSASILPTATAADMPFDDVKENDWFHGAVQFVYDNGIMKGVDDGVFSPNGNLTRAEFVTILCRMSNGVEKVTDTFTDVPAGEWYAGYIGWGADTGVVNGYEDHTFKPNAPMSRQEMAAAMVRYIDYRGINLPRETGAPYVFTDDESIDEWAEDYIDVLRISGIVAGDQDVNYKPQNNISRAEAATIIQRLYGVIDKAWQGYIPDPEKDGFAVYGANYLYNAGFAVQGGMGTAIYEDKNPYPSIYPYADKRSAELSYEPADSFGFSPSAAVADLRKMPVVKICYSYAGAAEPASLTAYLSNRTAMDVTYTKADLSFVKGADDAGWTTATCDLSTSIGEDLYFGTNSGSNVHIMFQPYEGMAGKDAKFLLRYIALFPDAESAEKFSSADYSDYLKNYFLYSSVVVSDVKDNVLEKYLGEIRDRIAEIKNSPSTITPADIEAAGGKCYYVSSINGNDANDGTSPDKAWKSINSLFYTKGPVTLCYAKAGDGVFFERGSEFYPSTYYKHSVSTLPAEDGVTYGAYGDAGKPKPAFYGSFDFGGGTGSWQTTAWKNIFVCDLTKLFPEDKQNFARQDGEIGNIIFNEGEFMGVHVFPEDQSDPFGEGKTTVDMDMQGNCKEYFKSGGTTCKDPGDALRNDLEFIHDLKEGKVYLRCEAGDPSTVFDRIDLCRRMNIVRAAEDARYDNLRVLYSGYVGLDIGDGNIATWCEAGYCGGDSSSVGTGIGGYGGCSSVVIDNCYIHDIEDGPMGFQYTNNAIEPDKYPELNGVVCTNNVIIAAADLVELFSTLRVAGEDGLGVNKIRNAVVTGNYAAYLGYGYPRSVENGMGKDSGDGLALHNWYYGEMVDCEFSDNTMVACQGAIIGAHVASDGNPRGWNMHDNTYVLNPEMCSYLRGTDGVTYTNLFKSFYASYQMPYTERYLRYLGSIGMDTRSEFYAYHSMTEGERAGAYVTNGYHVEHGDKPI